MSAAMTEPNESTPDRGDPRFQRLLEATRLAARGGYDAISMRSLAREAKMSLNTVYKFCGSKDQLIAEAHADRMEEFRARLAKRTLRGDTAEQRVKVVLRGIARALEPDDVVTRTLMRSIYSGVPGVAGARQSVTGSYQAMIEAAIGDDTVADRAALIETLGHVINSATYSWLTNGWSAAQVARVLDDAARVLFRPSA